MLASAMWRANGGHCDITIDEKERQLIVQADRVQLLRRFADSAQAPYSAAAIALGGARHVGQPAGSWLAPGSMARVLSRLVAKNCDPPSFSMSVGSSDGVLYRDELLAMFPARTGRQPPSSKSRSVREWRLKKGSVDGLQRHHPRLVGDDDSATESSEDEHAQAPAGASSDDHHHRSKPHGGSRHRHRRGEHKSVLIVVTLRLGLDELTPMYREPLRAMLSWPQSLGAVGGRVNESVYFVGHQGDNMVYLDPHYVQPAATLDTDASFVERVESFVCHEPKTMSLDTVNPSLALGLLCTSRAELLDLFARIESLADLCEFPPISLAATAPHYMGAYDATSVAASTRLAAAAVAPHDGPGASTSAANRATRAAKRHVKLAARAAAPGAASSRAAPDQCMSLSFSDEEASLEDDSINAELSEEAAEFAML